MSTVNCVTVKILNKMSQFLSIFFMYQETEEVVQVEIAVPIEEVSLQAFTFLLFILITVCTTNQYSRDSF